MLHPTGLWRGPPGRRRGTSWWLRVALLGALLGGVASVWLWTQTSETRAIRALPAEQRRGLYLRTVETLRTVCDPAPPRSLRDFCRAQAELATRFSECDEACDVLARRHLTPSR